MVVLQAAHDGRVVPAELLARFNMFGRLQAFFTGFGREIFEVIAARDVQFPYSGLAGIDLGALRRESDPDQVGLDAPYRFEEMAG
jgi:hypothetical protein